MSMQRIEALLGNLQQSIEGLNSKIDDNQATAEARRIEDKAEGEERDRKMESRLSAIENGTSFSAQQPQEDAHDSENETPAKKKRKKAAPVKDAGTLPDESSTEETQATAPKKRKSNQQEEAKETAKSKLAEELGPVFTEKGSPVRLVKEGRKEIWVPIVVVPISLDMAYSAQDLYQAYKTAAPGSLSLHHCVERLGSSTISSMLKGKKELEMLYRFGRWLDEEQDGVPQATARMQAHSEYMGLHEPDSRGKLTLASMVRVIDEIQKGEDQRAGTGSKKRGRRDAAA